MDHPPKIGIMDVEIGDVRLHPKPTHQPPFTIHQPPITNHQPPITNHQPPITNHPKCCQPSYPHLRLNSSPYLICEIISWSSALKQGEISLDFHSSSFEVPVEADGPVSSLSCYVFNFLSG